jgi:phosphoglycerate dehydrogenase-like enzyme
MSRMKIVSLLPRWEKRLGPRLGPEFQIVDADPSDTDGLRAQAREAEIVLTDKLTGEVAALFPALRLVVCPFAGTERIDRAALPAGVRVLNGGGTEEPIAEHIIAMLVATRRHLFEADRKLRSGEWAHTFWGSGYVDEVYGSTLGLIGYGRIGQETAKRAVAFGMKCRAVTLHPERHGASTGASTAVACEIDALRDAAAVDALVAESDAIAVCCELSELTRGLIDARRLALMKPSAVLINVARGPIVVERDLYEALRDKRIAGAVLDVWYKYPTAAGERAAPSSYPFGELDNVIMTPHNSGWTRPAMERRIEMIARALETFAATPRA